MKVLFYRDARSLNKVRFVCCDVGGVRAAATGADFVPFFRSSKSRL